MVFLEHGFRCHCWHRHQSFLTQVEFPLLWLLSSMSRDACVVVIIVVSFDSFVFVIFVLVLILIFVANVTVLIMILVHVFLKCNLS